jgi:hypothetical protein
MERLGATVIERIYPGMGHLINEDEREAIRLMLDAMIPSEGTR